ncbi:MAG: serine hydrolase [Candidatus Aminicenantes bacterium]|nr:serine hydrolase [Candidatus Aminicenantes bacterium]
MSPSRLVPRTIPIRSAVLLFGFSLILVSSLVLPAAQSTSPAVPKALKGFDALAVRAMAELKVPGLAVAAVQGGRLVYAQGFGFRDLAGRLPVTPHTIFGIGSCSKAFTATTMGILADEGKLDWDKPVRVYLPDFVLSDPVASERLTPRDLITHRTGLPRHDHVWIRSPFTRREMFERLRFLDFSRDIRQVYQYNNLMVMTAGYLVGTIAGSSWEAFAQARILDLLGMTETDFSTDVSQKAADFSKSYTLVKDKVDEFPFYSADALGPAGSINSSVLDMTRWMLANLNKGKYGEALDKTLISEKQLAQIQAPQTVVPDAPRYAELFYASYGMGWRVSSYRGHLLVSHGGAIMGFSAMVGLLPQDGIGVVLLNNLEDTALNGPLAYNILDRLLGLEPVDWMQRVRDEAAKSAADAEQAKREPDKDRKLGTSPSHALAEYAGAYEHPAYGTISVSLADGALKADFHQRTFVLEHYHYDVFRMKNDWMGAEYKIAFSLDRKGDIEAMEIPFEPSVKDIVFKRSRRP